MTKIQNIEFDANENRQVLLEQTKRSDIYNFVLKTSDYFLCLSDPRIDDDNFEGLLIT